MTIHEFTKQMAKKEAKIKQVNIAQLKEVLKVTNELVEGELYKLIKKL